MLLAELFPYAGLVYNIIMVLYFVMVLAVIGVVLGENRNPVKSIAWVLVLVLLPILGLVIYLIFGRSLKGMKLISRSDLRDLRRLTSFTSHPEQESCLSENSRQIISLVNKLTESHTFIGNDIQTFTSGQAKFDALKRDIENAHSFIHVQYFIIEKDQVGSELIDLLIQKARQGVKVRVLYDYVGSFYVSSKALKLMRAAGIEIHPFLELSFTNVAFRINWRNHRKIVIIDGQVGYMGGMNIADRYVIGDKNWATPWRDTHLRVAGDAVAALQYSFAIDWNFMKRELIEESVPVVDPASISNPVGVQLVTGGPTSQWGNMAFVFQKAIENARKSIYIQTPYFLPSDSLLKALQVAALSKVDVRLMIPRKPDSFLLRYASYSYVKQCLDAGIKIYFYEPGMLHAKVVVIDDEFVTTGSTNFDFRSFEHNFEGNLLLYSKDFNQRMTRIMHDDMMQSTRISLRAWRRRSMWQKALESLTRLFGPLL